MKSVLKYIKIFESFLGKKIYLILFFSISSAVMEAFGLLMIIPILGYISGEAVFQKELGIIKVFENLFNFLSLDFNLVSAIFFFIILFIFKGIFMFLSLCAISFFRGSLLAKLKLVLYEKLEKMEIELFQKKNSGHFVNLVNEQTLKAINSFNSLGLFLSSGVNLVIYLCFAIYVEWFFASLCALLGFLFFILFKIINKKVREFSIENSKISSLTSKHIIQLVSNFKYLRATNQSNYLLRLFENAVINQKQIIIKTGYAASFSQSIRDPVAIVLMMILIYWQVVLNQNSISTLVVALALFYRTLSSLLTVQVSWQKFLENSGSLTLINDEIKQHQPEPNYGHFKPKLEKVINFSGVSLVREEKEILKDLNFSIRKGKITSIVGQSGSGKTTILDILMGIIEPTEGTVFLDNQKLLSFDKQKWRSKIGYVSQDNAIFEGTIRENILGFGNHDNFNQEKLKEVAGLASLSEFIGTLPEGINTQVGDMGIKLSGGQKQRLLIARELYRDPELLILDEATSSVDMTTEREISSSILKLKNKITILIVAHRLNSVKNSDFVIVVKNGKIVEKGNYNNLINTGHSFLNEMK